ALIRECYEEIGALLEYAGHLMHLDERAALLVALADQCTDLVLAVLLAAAGRRVEILAGLGDPGGHRHVAVMDDRRLGPQARREDRGGRALRRRRGRRLRGGWTGRRGGRGVLRGHCTSCPGEFGVGTVR